MKLFRYASALAIAAVVSGSAASAYTLAQASRPKEYPSASYSKDVYVDSRGCVYVRANIGTAVNWVPRLSGDRKTVICNATPSGAAGTRTASAPPPPPPPPAPTRMPVTTAAAATTTGAASALVRPGTTTTATTAMAARTLAQPTLRLPSTTASTTPGTAAVTRNTVSRTLNVTCPSGGSTARVRIGGSTVAVNCDPAGGQAKSYLVRHGNGETTRLVANPAARQQVVQVRDVATTTTSLAQAGVRGVGDRPLVSNSSRVQIGGVAPGGATNNFGSGYGVLRQGATRGGTTGYTTGTRTYSTGTVTVQPRGTVTVQPGGVQPRGTVTNSFGNGYGLAPVQGAGRVYIPSGYRPAWKDGRLNPNRGPRTMEGNYQMAQVLDTSVLPMVDRTYDVGTYSTGTVVISSKNARTAPAAAAAGTATRQVVRTSAPVATSGKRYVQVGAYRDAANASAAAAKLKALGLPGRVAKTQSGLTVVIAGPYSDAGALQNALSVARRSFPDAYLRG